MHFSWFGEEKRSIQGDCSVSSTGFKGLRLNESVIKCAETHRGPAACMPSLAGLGCLETRDISSHQSGLLKYLLLLSLAENEKLRMHNQYAAKAKPNYVKV